MPRDSESSSALITTFAHDLRIPLRSMVMTIQRIQRRPEELSADTRSKLEEVLAAARRQDELISSVVEYDQALDPGLTRDTPLALRLAVQTACMKVDSFRQQKKGSVSFDAESFPRVLVASGIARVLEKLLHNGLKFQAADNPPLLEVEASESAGDLITIIVRDNGIGVEPVYRDAIFEPFKKLNPASDYPGSGLGLSTSRRLLTSINGTIHAEGNGRTAFVVRCPRASTVAA